SSDLVLLNARGCGATWLRASFGTTKSQVQILSPRPHFRPSATYFRPSATYSRPSATYSLSGCPSRLGPARLLGVMWETDGIAQEKREDENRAGTEQPGDASPAATPAQQTVRRDVWQTAPQTPRANSAPGL